MMALPKAACTMPAVRGGKKCDGESLDSIRHETKTLSHDYLMFIPERMDGTAFSKSDAVRWGMISQRIHVTLRNREKHDRR